MAKNTATTEHKTDDGAGKTRTRRTAVQLFHDAVKEKKDEIASLKTQLETAEKEYAAFVDQAKVAMGL